MRSRACFGTGLSAGIGTYGKWFFTERAKPQPVIDGRKMHGIFVDALRNGAEGEQH